MPSTDINNRHSQRLRLKQAQPSLDDQMNQSSGAQTSEQTNKPRFLISDLCAYLESYLSVEQVREVYRSYVFSAEAHEGQKRLSGEPYIYHPSPLPGSWPIFGWTTAVLWQPSCMMFWKIP